MNTYKNILVGYDDSKYSRAALTETLHWAKNHGSKVTVVHAVYHDHEEFDVTAGQLDERMKKGKSACQSAVESIGIECDLEVEYLVAQGEPREVIPQVARDRNIDLITMGTYGRTGIRRMLMGSVTSGVILDSPCDVLVVKRQCEECTGEYDRVLISYDGSEHSRRAIGKVAAITDPKETSITIIYVIPRYQEMIGFYKSASIQKRINEEARKIVLTGEKAAADAGIEANTVVEEGHVGEKIVETASGLESDLIIMGSHGWRGFDKSILGSTTERVIAHTNIPVLVVR